MLRWFPFDFGFFYLFLGVLDEYSFIALQMSKCWFFVFICIISSLLGLLIGIYQSVVHPPSSKVISVPVIAKTELGTDPNYPPPQCSLPFLRQFAREHHTYPTVVFNTINSSFTDNQVQQLSASASASCWFPSRFDKRQVSTAWLNKKINKILILGDSNGARYFYSALGFIKQTTIWTCNTVKSENLRVHFLPDASYFVREPDILMEHIKIRERDCSSCMSSLALCKQSNRNGVTTATLYIEYIALEFTKDLEISTERSQWTENSTCIDGKMCEHSASSQEFIFKEYLHGQYPDVLFYFTSSHEIARFRARNLRSNYEYLFSMMDMYLPSNAKAIFMNVPKVNFKLLPKVWQNAQYDVELLDANEALQRQNKIMYEVLEKYLVADDRHWYVFPNLFDSSTATDHMYEEDGVHMITEWYAYFMGALLFLLST